MEPMINEIIDAVVSGDSERSVEVAEKLICEGFDIEYIIHEGLTAALRSLDVKCTTEEFNLLEIMLAGRAMMAVMNRVVAKYLPRSSGEEHLFEKTIVLGTIKGDIHELGKHVVKMLLIANGFTVIDIGKDVSPSSFVEAAVMEGAKFIGVSSLITLTIPYIREIREILESKGGGEIKIIAGGAAIQQTRKEDLNVDFVARDAFDALHYLENISRAQRMNTPPLI